NSKDQVVGASDTDCGGFGNSHAFLWENGGPIVDLNRLVGGADMTLIGAASINDRGEITGFGVLTNADLHAFLLVPCDENHPELEDCDYSLVDTTTIASHPSPVVRDAATRTLVPLTVRPGYRSHFRGGAVGPRN